MTLSLRVWDFDMDSSVLGPIRCIYINVQKKFAQFEESIRAGTVDSLFLARDVFQTIARKRTGQAEVDAKSGGSAFSQEEVSTLPLEELDQFCDMLLKGRIRLVATSADSPPPSAPPAFPPGREGLAPALQYFAEIRRASMKRTLDTAERGYRGLSDIERAFGGNAAMRAIEEAHRTNNMIKAALGSVNMSSVAVQQALGDLQRRDDILKATAGIGDHIQEFLELTSASSASRAIAEFTAQQDTVRKALGMSDQMEALFGKQASVNTLLESVRSVGAIEEATRNLASNFNIADLEIPGLAQSEAAPVLPSPALPIYAPPPNPAYKTNEKLDELLAHRKAEAAKKDVDRSEATVESVQNKEVSQSGLRYTKASFWLAIIAFVVATTWGVWVYYDAKVDALEAKAEALENEKKSEIQMRELRAEIQALRASRPISDAPADGKAVPKGK